MILPCQRHLFDLPREVAYLDNAANGPLPLAVRQAGIDGMDTKFRPWAHDRDADEAWAERCRAAAAALIGARAQDIAIVSSISHAMAVARRNIAVPAGHRVLRIAAEFPSVALPWDDDPGVVTDTVRRPADGDWTGAILERLADPAAPPLALATLTPMHWSDGALIDLDRIVPVVKAMGAALVIDATQMVGALPLDVARWQPDFLAFPTYKWVLGPYSLAFLYAAPHRQDGRPLAPNQKNQPGSDPIGFGARRYDKGERNDPVGLPMAATGMELVLSWGVDRVEARLRHLTDLLAARLAALGLPVAPRAARAANILGLRLPGGIPPGLVESLAAQRVFCCERLGALRLSPHVYVDEADIDRVARAIEAALAPA
jgi:selenocysteine lyase/cysteine desulfurase